MCSWEMSDASAVQDKPCLLQFFRIVCAHCQQVQPFPFALIPAIVENSFVDMLREKSSTEVYV